MLPALFQDMFKFADCKLISKEGKQKLTHKIVLASNSDFLKMVLHNIPEGCDAVIIFPDITLDDIEILLDEMMNSESQTQSDLWNMIVTKTVIDTDVLQFDLDNTILELDNTIIELDNRGNESVRDTIYSIGEQVSSPVQNPILDEMSKNLIMANNFFDERKMIITKTLNDSDVLKLDLELDNTTNKSMKDQMYTRDEQMPHVETLTLDEMSNNLLIDESFLDEKISENLKNYKANDNIPFENTKYETEKR